MRDTINRILDTLSTISNNSIVTQISITMGVIISNFFLPIVPVILTCFGLTVIDLIYGLKVAKKQKVKIESKRTWNGTIKKLRDIFSIITMIRGIELYLLGGITGTALVGGCATIIGLTEFWSILENMNTLNPNGPWRALSKFMKKKGSEVIGTNIEELLNEKDMEIHKGKDTITSKSNIHSDNGISDGTLSKLRTTATSDKTKC